MELCVYPSQQPVRSSYRTAVLYHRNQLPGRTDAKPSSSYRGPRGFRGRYFYEFLGVQRSGDSAFLRILR